MPPSSPPPHRFIVPLDGARAAPEPAKDLLEAIAAATAAVDDHDAVALTAFNFTDFDLVLERCEVRRGALAVSPYDELPARTAIVSSACATGVGLGATGTVDWWGTHPDQGLFGVRMAWDVRGPGQRLAWASHHHDVPWLRTHGGVAGRFAGDVRVPTDFLETSTVAAAGPAGAELYYEVHARGTAARSVGALTRALHVDLGKGCARVRRLAAVAGAAVGLLAAPAAATAQSGTASFEGTHRAYNVWDDWKWWQPDKCTQTLRYVGAEPAGAGRYPVLVYTHGMLADWFGNGDGKTLVTMAAGQGFVAVAPTYDSWAAASPAAIDGNAKCLYGGRSGSVVQQVCSRAKADCSTGILVAGFSAGAPIAGRAANFADVRAAWLIGFNGPKVPEALAPPDGTRALANDRLRITTGRQDVEVRDAATGAVTGVDLEALQVVVGMRCAELRCLRADGSGFYIVDHTEVADGVADHCYWFPDGQTPSAGCTVSPTLEPGFRPPATTPWSLITNLRWLRSRLG